MSFQNTIDPEQLTVADCSRWAIQLASFINENPNDFQGWLAQSLLLHRKLEAAGKLFEAALEERETEVS